MLDLPVEPLPAMTTALSHHLEKKMKTPTKTLALTLLTGVVVSATTAAAGSPQPPPIAVPAPGPAHADFVSPDLAGPLVGSIEVTNERHRPMQVFIDGRFAAEVMPRTTTIIPNVPNGLRLVAYGQDRRGRFEVDKVEVRIDRRAALRIAPLRGIAVIHNESGIAMRVRFGDEDLGIVGAGQDLQSPPLLEGTYTLSYMPKDFRTATPRTERVSIQAGETVRVALAPFYARLLVRNPFPYPVNLFLDGRRVARIERYSDVRLDALMPARVDAQLRKHGRVMVSEWLVLDAGREVRWDPQGLRVGDLELTNPTRYPVRLQVGAMEGFVLRPGESRILANMPAGQTQIQVTLDDGRVVMHVADVVGGERIRFEVPRPAPRPAPVPVQPRPY